MASQENYAEEKTEVLYDTDEIIRRAVNAYRGFKYTCDVCADSVGPSMFVIPDHPVTKGFQDMKRRGIRLRFITEITKDNISSCEEFMKTVELIHLDDVKGNFGIGDNRLYQASAKNIGPAPPPLLIESTVKGFVEQQQILYFLRQIHSKGMKKRESLTC